MEGGAALEKVRVGIIGAGMIAHRSHAEAFQQVPRAKVVAVADVDEERARAFAAKYEIPRVFTRYEDLLATGGVDAVSVALPVFLHAPVTIAALEAGKHVLCEKPMARSSSEAQAMVDAARKSGRKLAVYWRIRFGAKAIKAKQMIDAGDLGTVYFTRTIGLRWRGRPGFDARMTRFGKWFGSKEHAGGGALMDIGGYNLDLVLGLLGFPRVLSASAATWRAIDRERGDQEGHDVEDLAVGQLRLEGGGLISVETSFAGNIDEPNGTWMFGTKAGLRLEPLTLYRDQNGEKKVTDLDAADVAPLNPVGEFIAAILNDQPIAISSGEEALIVTRVQELLYRSAEQGREVAYQEG